MDLGTPSAAPPPRRLSHRWRWVGLAAVALSLLFVVAIGAALMRADRRIAVDRPIAASSGPSVLILGPGGGVVASRGGFVGRLLTADELPQRLVDAVVSIEDRRFFDHSGIDLRGIARALGADLAAGAIREGGSTITQQLAKLEYAGSERTFARKFDELFLAWALERRYTKREILARYLNRVYLGAGVYGVDAGARRYFNRPLDQLSLGQTALLAGLIRSPSAAAPTVHPEAASARAAQVLDAMVETGAIKSDEAAAARAAPIVLAAGADASPGINYFADWAADQALHAPGIEAAGSDVAGIDARRGLVAQSTVDPILQRLAEQAIERVLDTRGAAAQVGQAAMVVMAARWRGARDGRRPRLPGQSVQPGDPGTAPARLGVQAAGLSGGARIRGRPGHAAE